MAYVAFGFPKALKTGLGGSPDDGEAIYASNVTADFVIVVFSSAVQVWSGSQHRVKLGEVLRTKEQLEEEGPNVRAHWCPQKRVLAVATSRSHLQLYALNVSSEALWRLPDSQELRRVNVFLSHSIHLDFGAVRIADLGGDAKSLLVALSNGTMQVFSWQGKLRGQSNPFIAAYEGSRSRRQQARTASLNLNTAGSLGAGPSPFSSLGESLVQGSVVSNGSLAAVAGGGLPPPPSRSRSSQDRELGIAGLSSGAASMLQSMDSLPLPTPAQPADVAVRNVHYAPAARMLAVVLRDGRCALCRTADSGIHPAEQLQLFRWVYKPAGLDAPAAVSAALNPTAQLLALGLSHGRVAIYTLQSILSLRHGRSSSSSASSKPQRDPSGSIGLDGWAPPPPSHGLGGSSGSGQPEPSRVLSLADWGFRSAVVGPASVLRWSPEGRVLAVGYASRGIAVWTPSGCRLMCSLRQAVATAMPNPVSDGPASAGMQMSTATPLPPASQLSAAAAEGGAGRGSLDAAGPGSPSKPGGGGAGGVWAQNSSLNPGQAPEPGVLEGGVSAMAWSAHGYQLLVGETGQARCLYQLEFARHMQGAHRVVQQAVGAGGGVGPGLDEVQALQAADRVLLISEARQTVNPALPVPVLPSAEAEEEEGAGLRPDLSVQHVKLPQQYIEAAYPLLHAAISHDCADVAVAGTRGLAVYSRRAQRWRLFGDATQERSLRVQGLMWLPSGIIAACGYVDGKEGGGTPQLLLYPQYHLDNTSLLARLPLKQVPVAMDSVGWHMVLAFAPLEVRLFRVAVEGPLGPTGRPIARLTPLRELSIMGLGNPLQEIALIDTTSVGARSETPQNGSASQLQQDGSQEQPAQQPTQQHAQQHAQQAQQPTQQPTQQQAQQQQPAGDGGEDAAAAWPQLKVATSKQAAGAGSSGQQGGEDAETPLQCVMLRAGGIMSKLDLQEGSEVLLSDSIERFWLPVSAAGAGSAAGGGAGSLVSRVSGSGFVASATGLAPSASGDFGTPSLSTSSSVAGLGESGPGSERQLPGGSAAAASYARMEAQQAAALVQQAELEGVFHREGRQAPQVEMPWWTYGARGMQLWFPSSLSEPLTPSFRSLTSPTATGLAAAAAAASTNSTDPELEFDREVYPVGVSLAEVSIVGVVQRTARSQAFPPEAAQSLCFHPLPESQPVLPCLLRRLLQKGRAVDALELARWHSAGPHFDRSLEWLLFTALEHDAEQRHTTAPLVSSPHGGGRPARQRFNSSYGVTVGDMPAAEQSALQQQQQQQQDGDALPGSPPRGGSGPRAQRRAGPLLLAAARLIAQFPQFSEIVVSVARKTDAALWPALFAAVGSPAKMCQGLLRADKLQSAACCLVIVEQIEGGPEAQAQALQLIQAALRGGKYSLASDLLRFLVPPGEAEGGYPTLAANCTAAAAPEAAELLPQQVPPLQQQQQEAEVKPQREAAAGVAAAQPAAAQQPAPQQGGSWFWGLFGGEAAAPAAAAPAAGPTAAVATAGRPGQHTPELPSAAVSQQQWQQQQEQQQEEQQEDSAAAAEAWRLTAQHAWRLLDSGALREAAQLARSLAELHGGLPALLVATAAEAPEAAAHLNPSAPAIASALFVAANEFVSADQELDAVLSAEQLLRVCQDAGCINLALALALLLGDQAALQDFSDEQPAVWAELHSLLANDVHLCTYSAVLSPLPSPMVQPPMLMATP